MMATVLIPLADGCEELEAITLIDCLRRADIKVVTASLTDRLEITASRGVRLLADNTLNDVSHMVFDMVILPGGQPGTDHLSKDERLHALLLEQHKQRRFLAAICAAPIVFAQLGILDMQRCTAYPGVFKPEQWQKLDICDDAIVKSGHILTSRGPGTAMDFALTLIEILSDKSTRQRVEKGLARH